MVRARTGRNISSRRRERGDAADLVLVASMATASADVVGTYCSESTYGPLQPLHNHEIAHHILLVGRKLPRSQLRRRFPAAVHTIWCLGCGAEAVEAEDTPEIRLLQGGPSENQSVAAWIVGSNNGSFDAVIDAGNALHYGPNALRQMSTLDRLRELWPAVSAGGRYYIDAFPRSEQSSGAGILTAWMEQLVLFQHPKVRSYRKAKGHYMALARVKERPRLPPRASYVVISHGRAIVSKLFRPPGSASEDELRAAAYQFKPVTDKFAGGMNGHSYQHMYGALLMPMRNISRPGPTKMLEVGLGCGMVYGPGASVSLWRHLFPHTERWEAEYNAACVNAALSKGLLGDIHVLVGDSANRTEVHGWVAQSGGGFDVVIDDSGHSNKMVMTDLDELWPALLPGGVYFAEDLHVAHSARYDDTGGKDVSTDFMRHLAEGLLITDAPSRSQASVDAGSRTPGASFVLCQEMACAIGKQCPQHDEGR